MQLRALGTYIHPPVTKDITNQVTWESNTTPDVYRRFDWLADSHGKRVRGNAGLGDCKHEHQ